MAADWIKMRGNLWDDPRVAKLCDLTDQPEAMVIGALYWLWAMANQHTADGLLPGLTRRQLDRKTSLPGFGDAMVSIGWLEDGEDGLTICRFEDHNGTTTKKRIQTAARVANHAAGKATQGHGHGRPSGSVDESANAVDSAEPMLANDEMHPHSTTCVIKTAEKAETLTQPEQKTNAPALAERYLEKEIEREREIQEQSSSSLVGVCASAQPPGTSNDDDDDGFLPRTTEAWGRVFRTRWSVPARLLGGEPFSHLARQWTAARLSVGAMALVVEEAHRRAPGGITALPEYAERVRQSLAAEAVAAVDRSPARQSAGLANPADVARLTVPSKPGRDPALQRIEADAAKAVPPPPDVRAKMAALSPRGGRAALRGGCQPPAERQAVEHAEPAGAPT
jgi:hypothetical protein